jgi:hypothetical protein
MARKHAPYAPEFRREKDDEADWIRDPIGLDDDQLNQLMSAAAALPVHEREALLHAFAPLLPWTEPGAVWPCDRGIAA